METCPNCGAELPKNAKSCPQCGSDENTGWSDEAHVGGLDLPDEEFNYEKFVDNEFDGKKKLVPKGLHPFWSLVAIAVVIAFVLLWFRF